MTVATAVAAAGLATAGPALAAPKVPLAFTVHAHRRAVKLAPAATSSGPTLYVNATTGSDTTNGASNPCTSAKAPCATIGHAVSVAPTTARISVAAGTYPEQVTVVSKNLTITGAGESKTFIEPSTLTETDSNTGVDAAVSFDGSSSGGLHDVTVNTITAASACTGSSYLAGLVTYDSDTSSSDDAVEVATYPVADQDACYFYGVTAYNGNPTTSSGSSGPVPYTTSLSSLAVTDYGSLGILCGYTDETCTISASKATGYGPMPGEQGGIELYDSPGSTISTSTVTDNTSQSYGGSFGFDVIDAPGATLTHDTATADDVDAEFDGAPDLYGDDSSGAVGPATITHDSFTHASNETGVDGGSPTPDGSEVGDGLLLQDVSDVTLQGDSLTSNANRGLDLLGVVNSTIGGSASGQPNTISHNADDGIALSEFSYVSNINNSDTIIVPSTGNSFTGNVVEDNGGDGIFGSGTDSSGNSQQSGNTFSDNTMLGNLRFDAFDESTGSGSDGTANTWTANTCQTSSPAGICSATIAN